MVVLGNASLRISLSCMMFIMQIYIAYLPEFWLMGASTYLKDYYKVLEVDYDASEEKIRLNYRRLALVGHLSFLIVP